MNLLKNLLTESWLLGHWYSSQAASWEDKRLLLKASWITWCGSIAIVPFALRLVFGPDTRVIFDRCRTWMATWRKHRRGMLSQKEQRQRHRRSNASILAIAWTCLRGLRLTTVPVGLG